MKLHYGQILILHKEVFHPAIKQGRPKQVYVVNRDPEGDYIIRLSETWPYQPGMPVKTMHKSTLIKFYKDNKIGIQTELFS